MNDYFNIPYLKPFKTPIVGPSSIGLTQTPVDSYSGFIRGNLFKELYEPYIEVEPFPLTPQTEREAMLNKVREYDFALLELNLYLDVFPNDEEKIMLFNNCLREYRQITEEYERRYGPLTQDSDALNTYPWNWVTTPWPWEVT